MHRINQQTLTSHLQYVRGTVRKGIPFSGKNFGMHIFTDADCECMYECMYVIRSPICPIWFSVVAYPSVVLCDVKSLSTALNREGVLSSAI